MKKEKTVYKRICPQCQLSFETTNKQKFFCCTPCQKKYQKRKERESYQNMKVNREFTDDTAIIIVGWLERRKMTINKIAFELRREPDSIKKYIEEIKANGKYDRIIKMINRKPEIPRSYNSSRLSKVTHCARYEII